MAVVGIVVAYWAVKAAPAVLIRTIPGLHDLAIDVRVLAFTGITCLATAVICALVPLPTLDRANPVDALRDDASRTTAGLGRLRVQRGFVVLTVGLACVLLAGAGLLIRSFVALVSAEIGFRPAQVLTASMTLPRTFYPTNASIRAFHESLLTSLSAIPGVRTAALATDLPLTTYDVRAFTPEDANRPDDMQPTTSLTQVHGPFFEALGMTLKQGRFFLADEYAHNRGVVVVNEKLAARFWPGQSPIGKRMKWGVPASRSPWLTVVGVIDNIADDTLAAEPLLHAYEPFRQLPDFFVIGNVKVAMLAEGDPRGLATLVRHEIARLDRELAVENLRTMDEQIRDVVAPQRFSMLLVGAFATIALLLASVGLYGLLAFTTGQRRKEIALRMALGAERHAVIGMVIGQGARLVAVGLTVGLLCSLALTRVMASLLYRTSPYDLVAFAIIPAVLVPAAFTACALPAWRAARVEPTTALRAE